MENAPVPPVEPVSQSSSYYHDLYSNMSEYHSKLEDDIHRRNPTSSEKSLSQLSDSSDKSEYRCSQHSITDIASIETVVDFVTKYYLKRTPKNDLVDAFFSHHYNQILSGSTTLVRDHLNDQPELLEAVLSIALDNLRSLLASDPGYASPIIPMLNSPPISGAIPLIDFPDLDLLDNLDVPAPETPEMAGPEAETDAPAPLQIP